MALSIEDSQNMDLLAECKAKLQILQDISGANTLHLRSGLTRIMCKIAGQYLDEERRKNGEEIKRRNNEKQHFHLSHGFRWWRSRDF